MVVQPAVESWVLNTTGRHSKWKTSLRAEEFLRDQHLLRWPFNSVPLLNSKPHCCDNKSLPLDPVLSWLKPFYILLLHVVNTDAHINIVLYVPRSHMWISDQNLNTSAICVFYNTFPIMPLAVPHIVNSGSALQGQTLLFLLAYFTGNFRLGLTLRDKSRNGKEKQFVFKHL